MHPSYKRKVSFNSLTPNLPVRQIKDEDLKPLYIPGQYVKNRSELSNKDLNFGFDPGSANADLEKIFNSFKGLNGNTQIQPIKGKKAPKLPPPPKKSSFKNWKPKEGSTTKRPSLLGLTYEELLLRDKQFSSSGGVDLTKLKFDGDTYLPHISSDMGRRSSVAEVIRPITNEVAHGDVDKLKSKKLHGAFSAFSLNFQTIQFDHEKSTRCVTIYINNHHEFNSILWYLKEFMHDYDQLIIIYEINSSFSPLSKSTCIDSVIESDHEINIKINRIINYYFKLIEMLKINTNISVTFEVIQNMKLWMIMQKLEYIFPNLSHFIISTKTLDSFHVTPQTLGEVLVKNKTGLKVVKVPKFDETDSNRSSSPDLSLDSDDPLFKAEDLSLVEISRQLSHSNLDRPYIDYINSDVKKPETKIKFEDTLHPEGKGVASRDGSVHSRNSNASSDFKKIKSLLDEDYNQVENSVKFSSNSTIKKSLTNTERAPLRKQISQASAVSVDRGLKKKQEQSSSGSKDTSKVKKGLFGLFSKKK